jgi:hypothetical protein
MITPRLRITLDLGLRLAGMFSIARLFIARMGSQRRLLSLPLVMDRNRLSTPEK